MIISPEEGPIFSTQLNAYQIKLRGEQTENEWAFIEQTIEPHCPPPPVHKHLNFSESLYLLSGSLTVQLEEEKILVEAGTFILVPKGVYHSFWNESSEPTKFLIFFHPAGFENFYKEWVELRNQEKTWPPKDPQKLDQLFKKYDVIAKPYTITS
jgi:quercetin dioxygenase-like cupin family protein